MLNFLRWWVPWEPSAIVVVVFALAVWLYWRGARRSPATAPWQRQWLFWLGLLVTYVCLHTHLDYYSEHQFFVNRLQQLGLQHVGPFLIALAYPVATIRSALPVRWRTRWRELAQTLAPLRWAADILLHPLFITLLFVGMMLFWLWPPVHFYAMIDWRLYRLMNWSMVLSGLLYWWMILDARPKPPARLAPGMRVLVEMVVMVPLILSGAYITFVHQDLYPFYSLCGRAFAGMAAGTDQHLGGLILWIPSSMMSVLGAVVAFGHWLRLDSKGRLPRNHRARAAMRARQIAAAQSTGPVELAGNTGKSA